MIATQVLSPMESTSTEMDDRIAAAVTAGLRSTGYAQLQQLHVRVDGHAVFLQGSLPSYYLKQIAHRVILALPVVHTIYDDIVVVS